MKELKEAIDKLLDDLLNHAKQQREAIPYSRTDGFPQAMIALGPNLEASVMDATWKNESEKRRLMRAVSETAKQMLCTAVVLMVDTRWVDGNKISPLLGLPKPDEVGIEEWSKLYSRAVQEKFGGYLGNMPSHYYSEAIIVIAKGPVIGTMARTAPYEKGDKDDIRWLDWKDFSVKTHHFNMLPDWWC